MTTNTRCPRCGGDNRCGIASVEACWCATEVVQKLPLPPMDAACYCQSCLEALLEESGRRPASAPAAPGPEPGV